MMKKLESFSSIHQLDVCCHQDMPAVSLAFSSSRHALCYGLVAFPDFVIFSVRKFLILNHACFPSFQNITLILIHA